VAPGFSVIIPLYNKAPHIEAALASALGQSISPAEVIVVDDGSTDGGNHLVAAMVDPRVKLVNRSPPGPGGYAARNLGIELSACEWVIFLDADDTWQRDHLETLAETLRACGSGVDCVFSAVDLVFPHRRQPRAFSHRYMKACEILDFETMLRAWLDSGECPIWTGGAIFRKQLLVDAGLFPAGRALRGGDKDLWLRAMRIGTCAYSGSKTAEFHQVAVNRVSKITSHSELPILVSTIKQMLPEAPAAAVPLLKRLSNQEIVRYARHSAGRGSPVLARFARHLYYPRGLQTLAEMAGYYALGSMIRMLGRSRTHPE
jgi:glycosyltransferase involved in cell wall biosynthesis